MCAHSSSGQEITDKITHQLYPFIAMLFQNVLDSQESSSVLKEYSLDSFYNLKTEFESLKNYEIKLVFPSVLKVFETKDLPGDKPAIDIAELQKLTRNKEYLIAEKVQELSREIIPYHLPDFHPICQLVFVMQSTFVQAKEQWHKMLNGWSMGCACFVAAQNNAQLRNSQN